MTRSKKGFEKKIRKDGTPNAKYVDVLEVDKPLAAQNFGCFSFISPEKILKQREMFYFEEFIKQWDMNKSMEKFHQFLNFVSFKYKLQFDAVMSDFEEFIKEERETISQTPIEGDYKTFLDKHEDDLEKKFNITHNFQTSVRGFKARGNFSTEEEARLRAKLLRESDPNFDIFVGPVGMWLPWEPEAYKTGDVEYMEEELNQLAHEKKKNETIAKNAFDQRVKDTKQKAMDDNKEKASKSGVKITQDLDENGNFKSVSTVERDIAKNDTITSADIRNELFEGENIVVGKTDYGQSQLTNPLTNNTD